MLREARTIRSWPHGDTIVNTRKDNLLSASVLGALVGIVPTGLAWSYLVSPLIRDDTRWSLRAIILEDAGYLRQSGRALRQHIDGTWPAMVAAHYPVFLTGATLAGALTVGGCVALARHYPRSVMHGVVGWAVGALTGAAIVAGLTEVVEPPIAPTQLLAMPIGSVIGGWFGTLLGAPILPEISTNKGTIIDTLPSDSRAAVKQAIRKKATAFGGVVLQPSDEVAHFMTVGVTRVGKSLALRELIYTSLTRGDRVLAADPDGGAMKHFYREGDAILNPYDARSMKWDLLAEIEGPADYANLAASLLPFSGDKEARKWEQWAQDIFAVCLRYWHENNLGTTDEFVGMMSSASNERLALLCEGQEAARVFKPGMEKTLGGILQTLSNVFKTLRLVAEGTGKPFSVRQWMREGKGSLWMPYMPKQIATLRELVSWWTSLAITEAMELGESETRRVWCIVDELDALGAIAGLKTALVRGGKFGVCAALGFQTIAQVIETYGQETGAAIVENCNNKLILRCNLSMGGGTALFASEVIGDAETDRIEFSNTETDSKSASSSTSQNVRRQVQKAVLPSEIMRLPKREGYLRTDSDPNWKRDRIAIIKHKVVVAPFIPVKAAGKQQTI